MKSKQIQEFKETEIGKIPADWEVEKLRNLLTTNLRHGIYKSKEFVNPDGVKILKMGILDSANWIGEQKMERFSVNDEELKKFKIHEGNIIFARTSMMTGGLGNCGIVMKHNEPIVFDGNLLCAELNTDLISPFFCLYYFKSKYGQDEISRMTGGTQSRSISSSELSKVLVILPSKSEQIKISKILFNLDTQIQNLQNQNCVLEQTAQAIFQSWFVNFNDVTEFEDSELGKIPKGWKICRLNELVKRGIGGDWGEENKFSDSIQVTCIRGTDIGELKKSGQSKKAPKRWIKKSSLEKRPLTDKNILLATSGLGPIGKSIYCHKKIHSLYDGKLMYTNFSNCLEVNTPDLAIYVEKTLENLYKTEQHFQYVTGTSIPNFDTNALLDSKILLPPPELIEKFAKISNLYFESLYDNKGIILEQTRDALLPKLMSGEIRV